MSERPHIASRVRAAGHSTRAPEAGFGVIEVIIVVAIIAIVLSAAAVTFRGAKRSSSFKVATAAALTYSDAVEAYMADNGQAPPAVGSVAWPATPREKLLAGPLNRMLVDSANQPRRYLKTIPEGLDSGVIDFGTAPNPSSSTARAYVQYAVVAGNYVFAVRTIPTGSGPVQQCVVTNAATPPAPWSGWERCA